MFPWKCAPSLQNKDKDMTISPTGSSIKPAGWVNPAAKWYVHLVKQKKKKKTLKEERWFLKTHNELQISKYTA